MTDREYEERPGLFGLLRRIPELISRLIRNEVESAKAELRDKLVAARLGLALTVVGIVLALYGLGQLIGSAVAGLDLVLPEWLAALIVALVLLAAAAILVPIGVKRLREALPPAPTETIRSVKDDVRVVRGTAR